jgi:ComF family protein
MLTIGFIKDFFAFLFPESCVACSKVLNFSEDAVCLHCLTELAYVRFHDNPENPIEKTFWGRIPVEQATALLYFSKKGRTQKLLHALKYQNRTEIGYLFGKILGRTLIESQRFKHIDMVIPVPLHKNKLRKRGYNQCFYIVEGIVSITGWQSDYVSLQRINNNETQTKKSRMARWLNVEETFAVVRSENLKNKHILLIDDVLTTGSTLEACARKILAVEGTKVSIATVALTR